MKPIDYLKLVAAIIGVELVGFIGAIFTMSAIPTWYAHLARPSIAPPNWVFAPVWTALFVLMGIAAFLVWRAGWKRRDVKIAFAIFVGQLALNVLWSVLFFGLHQLGAAFLELVALWLAILATIGAFSKISKSAALLLLPYILWVSFAGALNVAFWMLNGA
jgi:tryptophan-rich sensory protein